MPPSVEQIYAQIEDELRHQYNLGYTPNHATDPAAGYHKIQLVAKRKTWSYKPATDTTGTDNASLSYSINAGLFDHPSSSCISLPPEQFTPFAANDGIE
jgi:hypothetical protein